MTLAHGITSPARFGLIFRIGAVCVGLQLLKMPIYVHNEAPTYLLVIYNSGLFPLLTCVYFDFFPQLFDVDLLLFNFFFKSHAYAVS